MDTNNGGLHLQVVGSQVYLKPGCIHKQYVVCTLEGDVDNNAASVITNTTIILVIDASSSMRYRLPTAKAAIYYLIEHMDESCKVCIITFNSQVNALIDVPVTMDNDGRRLLNAKINDIVAGGKTALHNVILYTLNYVKKLVQLPNRQVLLFTDGCNTIRDYSWHTVETALKSNLDDAIPFHTFSIGNGPDAAKLSIIANSSAGGCYEHMCTDSDIAKIMGERVDLLKSERFIDCCLEFEASRGTRIVQYCGVECAFREEIANKKYKFRIGNMSAGCKKIFICKLSVRDLGANESTHDIPHTQHLIHIRAYTGKHIATGDLVVSRVDDCPPLSGVQHAGLSEAYLYMKFKKVVSHALLLAEMSQFSPAMRIITDSIEYFKQLCATKYIEQLTKLYVVFRSNDSYKLYRNATYSLLSSYDHQQGGQFL